MNTKSPARVRGGSLTFICIGTGLWIGIMAGANLHRYALAGAIIFAFAAIALNYKQYQTYKEETANRNMSPITIHWIALSSLYNAAWIYCFAFIGKGIRFLFAG